VKSFVSIILLCLALGIAGCGGDGSSDGAAKPSTASGKAKPEAPKPTKPDVRVPKSPPPKKLVKEDLEKGSGPVAKPGDQVTVQYVGVEYKSGKQIDASWDRGEPFEFQLGAGGVIPAWEEGVQGMKVGGRRQLLVPSNLAYGSGALVFVIDLLAVNAKSPDSSSDEPPKPKVEVPSGPPPQRVVVKDLKEGSGAEVEANDKIVVNYVGVSYRTGKEFETVWGEPTTFQLGVGEVIQGWEQGIKGMKVGGRRELVIPSKLAFKRGAVVYVIDLVDIE
jgi:peptidylprolyl isomerase